MRSLSFFSGLCLFVGLTLVLFVGGLVVYETCFGEPLFDYGILPGADKDPDGAAKAGGRRAAAARAPAARGGVAKGRQSRAAQAAAAAGPRPEFFVPHYTVSASWDSRGDLRATLRPRLRGFAPRSLPFYIADEVSFAPLAGPDPYVLEVPASDWRREQAREFRVAAPELTLGDVQWIAFGACPRLPALKGRLDVFYPENPVELAWENPRAGNNQTLEHGGMRFTLRNRQLTDQHYRFSIEFVVPDAKLPRDCFVKTARAFLRSHGKPGPFLSPIGSNCRRRDERLEGTIDFMIDVPLAEAEVAFRCYPRMQAEPVEFVQPEIPLPPFPGGRRLSVPASDEPPAQCMVEGLRLAATGLSLSRDCFGDGRPESKFRCALDLRWDLGQRSKIVSCQGEGKGTATGAGVTAEARVRCLQQGHERDGRRMVFRVEWEEGPEARPGENGVRRVAGTLPPVQLASAWKTVEFAIERNAEGRPVVPQERDGLKLLRANENPNGWCNYVIEVAPEIIPQDVFPLVVSACEVATTPAAARQAWQNVHRNGQNKTIVNANFRRGDAPPQKVTLRWPTVASEAELRFSLPDVPLPERREPVSRELF